MEPHEHRMAPTVLSTTPAPTPCPKRKPAKTKHTIRRQTHPAEGAAVDYRIIVLFVKVAKNSLDKRLRILFFSRALCLIRTWQATEPENP